MHLAKLQLQIGGERSCIAPPHQLFMSQPAAVLGGPPCSESTFQTYPSEFRFSCNTHLFLARRAAYCAWHMGRMSVVCDIRITSSKDFDENLLRLILLHSYCNKYTFFFDNFFFQQRGVCNVKDYGPVKFWHALQMHIIVHRTMSKVED